MWHTIMRCWLPLGDSIPPCELLSRFHVDSERYNLVCAFPVRSRQDLLGDISMSESLNINESLLTCTALLTCHPTTANPAVQEITVRIGWGYDGALVLTYMLTGDCNRLRIPDVRPQAQIDGLWQHTCLRFLLPRRTVRRIGSLTLLLRASGQCINFAAIVTAPLLKK